jgi:hypothetical protein
LEFREQVFHVVVEGTSAALVERTIHASFAVFELKIGESE